MAVELTFKEVLIKTITTCEDIIRNPGYGYEGETDYLCNFVQHEFGHNRNLMSGLHCEHCPILDVWQSFGNCQIRDVYSPCESNDLFNPYWNSNDPVELTVLKMFMITKMIEGCKIVLNREVERERRASQEPQQTVGDMIRDILR